MPVGLDPAQAGARLDRALSVGSEPRQKAAWVEGFLAGSGLLLVHDRNLLALLDSWVRSLSASEFVDVVALLRRTFGQYQAPERRSLAAAIKGLTGGREVVPDVGPSWDVERAAPAMATAAWLLGLREAPDVRATTDGSADGSADGLTGSASQADWEGDGNGSAALS